VSWPLGARAQQSAVPVVGFVSSLSPGDLTFVMPAFHQGLNAAGFDEGHNVTIEYRWAEGHYDRLPALSADLVRRQVAVIAAISGTPAVAAQLLKARDHLRYWPARHESLTACAASEAAVATSAFASCGHAVA
jgi:ABC-type uncharacterized transport system substrate-binding protein